MFNHLQADREGKKIEVSIKFSAYATILICILQRVSRVHGTSAKWFHRGKGDVHLLMAYGNFFDFWNNACRKPWSHGFVKLCVNVEILPSMNFILSREKLKRLIVNRINLTLTGKKESLHNGTVWKVSKVLYISPAPSISTYMSCLFFTILAYLEKKVTYYSRCWNNCLWSPVVCEVKKRDVMY